MVLLQNLFTRCKSPKRVTLPIYWNKHFMLQINNLSFDYADAPLLDQLTFTVPSGHLLHLQGENGSGKTTLLKLLSGLLSPSEGTIYFQGEPVESSLKIYQKQLCYIGHKTGISPALTPRQNVLFDTHHGRRLVNLESSFHALSLHGLEDVPCFQLSAGQRRRVALLRLLMTTAQLWLLDEPFVALDTRAIDFLKERLEEHLVKGGAVVLTSHQSLPFKRGTYLELCL